MTNTPYAIGIDIGGTKTRFGVVSMDTLQLASCLPDNLSVTCDTLGKVELVKHADLLVCKTPTLLAYPGTTVAALQADLLELLLMVVQEIRHRCTENVVTKVGISFAGLVDDGGTISKAADLYFDWGQWTEGGIQEEKREEYVPFELRRLLSERMPDLQWQIVNDVTAAACRYVMSDDYEMRYKTALLTISTGIGYVLMSKDRFFLETAKVVSLGHHVVDTSSNARTCDCGGCGHLTAYASGKAVEKRIKELAAASLKQCKHSALWHIVLQRLGTQSGGFTDEEIISSIRANDVALAIRQHDEFVMPLFVDVTAKLAYAMTEIIDTGVESIVIMGGFAHAIGQQLLDGLIENLSKTQPWITPAYIRFGFADDADGVIGACGSLCVHEHNHQGGMSRSDDVHGNVVISLDATTHHTTRINEHFTFNIENRDFYHCVASFGELPSKAFFVVESTMVAEYKKQIIRYCRAHHIQYKLIAVTTSKTTNSMRTLTNVLEHAKAFGVGRTDIFVAVGKTTTIQLVGMAAGVYRRGISYIAITNDGVGLKTLIKKPMTLSFLGYALPIGTPFHPPANIFISTKASQHRGIHKEARICQLEKDAFSVYRTDGLFQKHNTLLAEKIQKQVAMIVISYAAKKLYGEQIKSYLKHHKITAYRWCFTAGEEGKYWSTALKFAQKIAKKCSAAGNEIIVAIGGGVTMDIAGFSASLIGRPYLRVPTTLLGAIDAGVGIKVGVNFTHAKNFLGDFYSPKAALIDTVMLRTVSARNIRAGLAEIIKMGVIIAPRIIELLEHHTDLLISERFQKDTVYANEVIDLSIYWMMSELQRNLHEDHSLQRLVDFGHAFSPVIELRSHHKIIHGEAVALDMAICAELAFRMKHCTQITRDRIHNLLQEIGLDVWHPLCESAPLYAAMSDIRLHRGGNLNLPLPTAIGSVCFVDSFEEHVLTESLQYLEKLQNKTKN